MLWIITAVLLILWFAGMATSHTLHGFIHVFLVLAVIPMLIRVTETRNPV